jgi:hypothetical protein
MYKIKILNNEKEFFTWEFSKYSYAYEGISQVRQGKVLPDYRPETLLSPLKVIFVDRDGDIVKKAYVTIDAWEKISKLPIKKGL